MSLNPSTPTTKVIHARSAIQGALRSTGVELLGELPEPRGVRVLLARGEHTVDVRMHLSRSGGFLWHITARRAGAAVELSVRPELAGEGIDKLLGMTLDLDTGDARFDARFVVEAAPAAVMRHLLDADLRAAMLGLPTSDEGPSLRVDASTVALAWEGRLSGDSLAAALRGVFDLLDRCRALHEALAEGAGAAPFRALSSGTAAVDPSSREAARARIGRAHRKATAFVATAAMVGAALLASVFTVSH